ncbi:hypothetical protein AU467_33495 [Mesorhizobium loti]|uniref:ABC transmembrane type-1 domain-containing protein n=1 Tax=Rhizobium loti TaxID=381 RepID=A0A101KMA9_RHILI|nr:hypothetical protein AU467_33495 [Mesorhizobium loti]
MPAAVIRGARVSYPMPWRDRARHWLWYLPALTLVLSVTLVPMMTAFWIAVHSTHFYDIREFVGLDNFRYLFDRPDFALWAGNSLIYVTATLALALSLGLGSAILLQSASRGSGLFRTVLLLPWTFSLSVAATFWLWLYNPSFGLIPLGMKAVGIQPGLMLGNPNLALLLLIISTAWWSFPHAMVILSAALQSVPKELYEAVAIDGGSAWHSFRHVTLPHVLPTLCSAGLILGIGYLTLVTMIIVLTGGGPLGATTTWSFWIFRETASATNVGPAAVMSIIVLLVNVAMGVAQVKLTSRAKG